MKYGIREICDVVLRAKTNQKIGNKIFYKHEPVIYFDTLKTSTLEGAATTVYATGGRGNTRLVAWEGERTLTFTMEDALISPVGFMILSGAGLIEASEASGDKKGTTIYVHSTEQTDNVTITKTGEEVTAVTITLEGEPAAPNNTEDYIYVMLLDDNGEVSTEPYIPTVTNKNTLTLSTTEAEVNGRKYTSTELSKFKDGSVVLVDYYIAKTSGVQQIEITADKFGGNYYLEASTLFRDTNGVDKPAEFIIPNCKVQSNFTFTMASSGDPSSFTFTMDAFPDYTRFDRSKKVLAALQIIDPDVGVTPAVRNETPSNDEVDFDGSIKESTSVTEG